jgi:hypothetical protein
MIDDGGIALRLILSVAAHPLIDGTEVVQHSPRQNFRDMFGYRSRPCLEARLPSLLCYDAAHVPPVEIPYASQRCADRSVGRTPMI